MGTNGRAWVLWCVLRVSEWQLLEQASCMLVVYYGVCGDLAAFAQVTIARATRVSLDTALARVHAGRQGHARRYRVLRVHLTTSRALAIVIAFPCGAMWLSSVFL